MNSEGVYGDHFQCSYFCRHAEMSLHLLPKFFFLFFLPSSIYSKLLLYHSGTIRVNSILSNISVPGKYPGNWYYLFTFPNWANLTPIPSLSAIVYEHTLQAKDRTVLILGGVSGMSVCFPETRDCVPCLSFLTFKGKRSSFPNEEPWAVTHIPWRSTCLSSLFLNCSSCDIDIPRMEWGPMHQADMAVLAGGCGSCSGFATSSFHPQHHNPSNSDTIVLTVSVSFCTPYTTHTWGRGAEWTSFN